MANEQLLSVDDVARILSVSRSMVYKMMYGGMLPETIRVGSLPRWRQADIDQWIADRKPD